MLKLQGSFLQQSSGNAQCLFPRKILENCPLPGPNPPNLVLPLFFRTMHRIGNGPNTVSESTVSNTELNEFFGPHRVPAERNSVSSFQPSICVPKRTHRVFPRTHRVRGKNSVSSLFRNTILETLFHPLPKSRLVYVLSLLGITN